VLIIAVIVIVIVTVVVLAIANEMYARRVRAQLHQGIGEDGAEMTQEMRDVTAAEFTRTTGRFRRQM